MCREQGALSYNRGNYLDVLCDEIIIFGAKSYVVKGLQQLGSSTHRRIDEIGRIQPKEVGRYVFLSASNDNKVEGTDRHTDELTESEGFN